MLAILFQTFSVIVAPLSVLENIHKTHPFTYQILLTIYCSCRQKNCSARCVLIHILLCFCCKQAGQMSVI